MSIVRDDRVRDYIMPKKVIFTTGDTVENHSRLLDNSKAPQASFDGSNVTLLKPQGGFLLDFGKEYHGGVQIIVQNIGESAEGKQAKLRVRFGESAMEAMSNIGEKGATNDHSPRDVEIAVSQLGSVEVGATAFRFVRIDSLYDGEISIKLVRAVYLHRDLEYKGSFKCNDELLNEIWKVGAYTVELNMGDYVWDGVKRDRLVWIGDMHPETSTIQAVFGYDKAVPKSLDLVKADTKPTSWMNGIPSYSLWWIRIQHDWYMHTGDKEYLLCQIDYLKQLIDNISAHIKEDGTNDIGEGRWIGYFIDWPTSENPVAQRGGVHAILVQAYKDAKEIFTETNENEYAVKCEKILFYLEKNKPSHGNSKAAASLLALSKVLDAKQVNETLLKENPYSDISTFLGYYVLKARDLAGDTEGALDLIRVFWGEMLKLGATTFWEDFNMDWSKGAKSIDTILKEGEYDVHGDNGAYCYKGYRHSFCHGWASGPTAFLSECVLGIRPAEPGFKKVNIKPSLGNLQYAEGEYPTPYGSIYVKHEKQSDGSIKTDVKLPEGVEIA